MPGSTSRGYPYPLGPEQALGSTDIQSLGEAVDADVTGVVAGVAADIAGVVPAGAIMAWAGAAAPSGWQLCDGTLLRRLDFPDLFAAIGTQYGEGDGVETFAAPNLQGVFVLAAGGGYALNSTGGAATHTLTEAEMPRHYHDVSLGQGRGALPLDEAGPGQGASNRWVLAEGAAWLFAEYTGGSAAHNNMPPYLALNYIIKL